MLAAEWSCASHPPAKCICPPICAPPALTSGPPHPHWVGPALAHPAKCTPPCAPRLGPRPPCRHRWARRTIRTTSTQSCPSTTGTRSTGCMWSEGRAVLRQAGRRPWRAAWRPGGSHAGCQRACRQRALRTACQHSSPARPGQQQGEALSGTPAAACRSSNRGRSATRTCRASVGCNV